MYLIDTNVISEARKQGRADPGVLAFFQRVADRGERVYLSVVTVGELRCGIERIARRGDGEQAARLARWLGVVLNEYAASILPFDADAAQVWGRLLGTDPAHPLDKQIAASALVHDLTVVTRNVADFAGTGAKVFDPFAPSVHEPRDD